jgi:hypothetical protein
MMGSRKILGLALICALALCGLAASGASAKGTTAFTCSASGGEKDFSDAHCDNSVGAGKGSFGHASIAAGSTKEMTLSNEKTASETTGAEPSHLIGKIAGITVEVVCSTVTGSGTVKNEEVEGTMQATGKVTMEHSKCAVTTPTSCATEEPIIYKGHYKTYQNEIEMGLEFLPEFANEFGTFVLKNNGAKSCPINGKYKIEGSFEGTPHGESAGKGATLVFTKEMGKLTWAGQEYTLTGAITMRIKGGDPIVFTT